MEEIILANLALALVEKMMPRIEAAVKSGQASVEEQGNLRTRFNNLRSASAFLGPEWEA